MIEDAQPLFDWANEREMIRIKKDRGDDQPWTEDEILQTFRFCNVYREEDRVTKWVKANVRDAYADNPNLWLMILLTRIINWTPTIEAIIKDPISGWPVTKYSGARVSATMEEYKHLHTKMYTGAYFVRAESNKKVEWYGWPKERYVAEIVVQGAWERRKRLESAAKHTIREFVTELTKCYGIGPFIAYQTAVDLSWCPGWLDEAPDLDLWAMCGPGTTRGLNRLSGRKVDAKPKESLLLSELAELHDMQGIYLKDYMRPIRLSDITNACCETDKYLRVKSGEGRPRNKYVKGRGY